MKKDMFSSVPTRAFLVDMLSVAKVICAKFPTVLFAGMLVAGSLNSLAAYGQPSKRGLQATTSSSDSGPQLGKYYALVIGNNKYKYVAKLQTAVNDADAVDQLLRDRYGFTVKLLHDATRDDILTALNEYRRTLPVDSNLMIYYAGHGYKDPDTNEAYWLPVDAQKDNNQDWISADDISSDAHAIPSRHILIISDSCFSGELARDADVAITPTDRGAYLAKLAQSKSRNLMSSGGNEPVADGGAPGHSIFASAVLDSLRRIDDDRFTAAELFSRFIQPAVAGSADQVPQYGVIRKSGHNYGDFVFSRLPDKNAKGKKSEVPASHADSNRTNTDSRGEEAEVRPSSTKKKVPEITTPMSMLGGNSSTTDIGVENTTNRPSLVPKVPRVLNTPTGQRYPVVHYSGIDSTQFCAGWMTVDRGVIRYQGLKGTHGVHNFEFPFDGIKEVKQNALIFLNNHAFHIRLSSGNVENFSLFDVPSGAFLSPDLLLNEVHTALAR